VCGTVVVQHQYSTVNEEKIVLIVQNYIMAPKQQNVWFNIDL